MTISWFSYRLARHWIYVALLLTLSLAASSIAAQEPPAQAEPPIGEADPAVGEGGPSIPPGLPLRKTLAPWIVNVWGKTYADFTNDGASRVISDWLTNALIDLKAFNVVDRERIRAVLSEKNLELSGFARDISSDVPENELATAGKVLRVDYILLGNVKNLGTTSEIDFKLLDVETTTYSPDFRLNFQIPFNPSIEKFRPVVDRIAAKLAESFPIVAPIGEVRSNGHLILAAGSRSGLAEGQTAELWLRSGWQALGTGVITRVTPMTAELTLDRPIPALEVSELLAKVKVLPGPEAVLSKARLEIGRGNLEEAREILAIGLSTYPGHSTLLALHAQGCWQLHDYEQAVISYRDALKAEPNDQALLEEAAQVLSEAGQFEELVDLLRALEPTKPLTLSLELHLGDALAMQGYPQQAREAYKRAYRLDPEAVGPHLRLAALAARAHEREEVARELRLAREGSPSALEVELASALAAGLESSDLAAARPWIERAVAEGDFAALGIGAEILLAQPGLWQTALELANKSAEINPSFLKAHILAAEANELSGDTDKAIQVLEQALEARPNSVVLLVRLGKLHSETGNLEEAVLLLRQAADLAPLQWRPADALGDIYFTRREYLKAIDAYKTALSIADQNGVPELTPRLQKLGRAAVLGNQHAAAQPYLERCVERAPDNEECRYYLGLCHLRSNLPENEEKAIANLEASEDFETDAYFYLGTLYDRRETFPIARDWYQRCVDSGCSQAGDSEARIDEIETIRGHIIGQPRHLKEVTLDVGRIHGVLPSQTVTVISRGEVVAKLQTEQVLEKSTLAKILGGEPLTGHVVVFRPTRPRQLTAEKAPKRGVALRWNQSVGLRVAGYIVERREGSDQDWKVKKRVGPDQNQFIDKSAVQGKTYRYRVVAVSGHDQTSVPSRECEITVE